MERRGYLLVALAAGLAHASALSGGFIWLDHGQVTEGAGIAPPSEWLRLFGQDFAGTGFYRPLMALSLSIDALLGGSPLHYHAVTLAWHALAAVMVTAAGRALALPTRAAVLAGVLFGVHPVTAEVADAIAFRSEAMIAVFLLGLVVAHVRSKPVWASACLLLGALTKETALVLAPLLLVAYELSQRPLQRSSTKLRLWSFELVAWLAAAALRLLFADSWRATFPAITLDQALGTRLSAVTKSAAALLAVTSRTICDAFPLASVASASAMVGALLLLGVAFVAWRQRPLGTFFALALLPSLQPVPIMRWWSPHYLYMALAFGALLASRTLDRWGRPAYIAALPIAVVLGGLSFHDGARFLSDEALWTYEVSADPTCREGQFFVAEVHRERGEWAEAAARYGLAITPDPAVIAYVDQAAALQNFGAVEVSRDRLPQARLLFRASLELTQGEVDRRKLLQNLAIVALLLGEPAEAVRELESEVARADALPASLALAATALDRLGRVDEANSLRARAGLPPAP